MSAVLRLENRHTGEVLIMRRVRNGNEVVLEMEGHLPPRAEGPPLHIHLAQREEGVVVSGVLSAILADKTIKMHAGESAVFAAGIRHRWWNADDQPLHLKGRAIPAGDLDRFLQAIFAITNAGSCGRMPLFYISHVMYRHRHTHRLAAIPLAVQRVLFPGLVLIGWLLGKYRGNNWPGAPASCPGAPET